MVNPDNVVIERNETGSRVAREEYVEEFDTPDEDDPHIKALPMTKAEQDRYIQPFIEAVSTAQAIAEEEVDLSELDNDAKDQLESMGREALSDEKLAGLFGDCIVDPDLVQLYDDNCPDREIEELDEDFIKYYLDPGAKDGLFFGVLIASDMEDLVEAFRQSAEVDADEADGDAEAEVEAGNAA